jgi:hypothetical protein
LQANTHTTITARINHQPSTTNSSTTARPYMRLCVCVCVCCNNLAISLYLHTLANYIVLYELMMTMTI